MGAVRRQSSTQGHPPRLSLREVLNLEALLLLPPPTTHICIVKVFTQIRVHAVKGHCEAVHKEKDTVSCRLRRRLTLTPSTAPFISEARQRVKVLITNNQIMARAKATTVREHELMRRARRERGRPSKSCQSQGRQGQRPG